RAARRGPRNRRSRGSCPRAPAPTAGPAPRLPRAHRRCSRGRSPRTLARSPWEDRVSRAGGARPSRCRAWSPRSRGPRASSALAASRSFRRSDRIPALPCPRSCSRTRNEGPPRGSCGSRYPRHRAFRARARVPADDGTPRRPRARPRARRGRVRWVGAAATARPGRGGWPRRRGANGVLPPHPHVLVDDDRVGDLVTPHRGPDGLTLPLVGELGTVNPDDEEGLFAVFFLEVGEVRKDVHAVDAAIGPEIQQDYLAP